MAGGGGGAGGRRPADGPHGAGRRHRAVSDGPQRGGGRLRRPHGGGAADGAGAVRGGGRLRQGLPLPQEVSTGRMSAGQLVGERGAKWDTGEVGRPPDCKM